MQLNNTKQWSKINLCLAPQDELEGNFSNKDVKNDLLHDADDSALPMLDLQDGTDDQGRPNTMVRADEGGLTLGGAVHDPVDNEAFDRTAADETNRAKENNSRGSTQTMSTEKVSTCGSSNAADQPEEPAGEELSCGKRKKAVPKQFK